ncbi:MAG: recombinase family protein [Candidatus Acidiferrales bacterium]
MVRVHSWQRWNIRVGVYARVSTVQVNGLKQRQNPEMQLAELREYCQRRGWAIQTEYVDRMTGSKESRPELDKMMADAKRRRFDVVLVWKFDRFARSVSHLLRALEEFKSLGIEFVSLTEGIDTSTPVGKMTFTVLGAVAELERSLIVERVRAGMAHAKSKGVKFGRARFDVDIAAVRHRIKHGESLRSVARSMKVSPALLVKRLKAAS